MSDGLKVTFKGVIKQFKDLTNPSKLKAAIRKNVKIATIRNTLIYQAKIKNNISRKKFAKNAKLTLFLKGTSKPPLVDSKQLNNAIEVSLKSAFLGEVGILNSDSREANLARILQSSSVIKITPSVRAAIFAKMRNRRGKVPKKVRSLRSKGFIKVPARKFLEVVFSSQKLKRKAFIEYELAMRRAFKEVSGGKAV